MFLMTILRRGVVGGCLRGKAPAVCAVKRRPRVNFRLCHADVPRDGGVLECVRRLVVVDFSRRGADDHGDGPSVGSNEAIAQQRGQLRLAKGDELADQSTNNYMKHEKGV